MVITQKVLQDVWIKSKEMEEIHSIYNYIDDTSSLKFAAFSASMNA